MKKIILFITFVFSTLLCIGSTHNYYIYVPSDLKPYKYHFTCEDCGKNFTRDVFWSDQLKRMYHYGDHNVMEVYSNPSKICRDCASEQSLISLFKIILIMLGSICVIFYLFTLIARIEERNKCDDDDDYDYD